MPPHVRAVDTDGLETLLASEDRRPLLIDFHATWCEPCEDLKPELEEFAGDQEHRLRVVSVDVDANEELTETYGVRAMPTLVLIHERMVVAVLCGDLDPLDRVCDLLDALGTFCPPQTPAPRPGLGRREEPRPARQLRFTGPLPGELTITAQAGLTTETVIDVSPGHTTALTITTDSGAGLERLAALAPDALDSLNVSGKGQDATGEGELDIAPLLHLIALENLSIDAGGIAPDALGNLARLRRLKTLDIPDDTLSRTDLEELQTALPHTVINDEWVSPSLRALLPAHEPVAFELIAHRHSPGRVTVYLTLLLAPGYHLHSPGHDAAHPVTLILTDNDAWHPVNPPVFPATHDGLLTGSTLIAWDLAGAATEVELAVTIQACDEEDDTCLPPTTHVTSCGISSPVRTPTT